MIDRLAKKATELETSNAAANRHGWVVWFALGVTILPGTLTALMGHWIHRAPWMRPYVIDTAIDIMKVMLVFSVVMIGWALWRVYTTHKRPRV